MQFVKAVHLTSRKDRILGLIGKDVAIPVYITTRFGIHTFGLKFAIDVLILNDQHQVINIKKNLPPGRIFFWSPKFKHVLELPRDYISNHRIKKGDILKINV